MTSNPNILFELYSLRKSGVFPWFSTIAMIPHRKLAFTSWIYSRFQNGLILCVEAALTHRQGTRQRERKAEGRWRKKRKGHKGRLGAGVWSLKSCFRKMKVGKGASKSASMGAPFDWPVYHSHGPIFYVGSDLRGNAFHCDCKLKWLVEWLSYTNAVVEPIACRSPTELNRTNLNDLRPGAFNCITTGNLSLPWIRLLLWVWKSVPLPVFANWNFLSVLDFLPWVYLPVSS